MTDLAESLKLRGSVCLGRVRSCVGGLSAGKLGRSIGLIGQQVR